MSNIHKEQTLSNRTPRDLVRELNMYGPLVLFSNTDKEKMLTVVSVALMKMDEEFGKEHMLMATSLSHDGSWYQIVWEYEQCGQTNVAQLIRRIKYNPEYDLPGREPRSDQVIRGPIVKLDHAPKIVDLLNSLDWS